VWQRTRLVARASAAQLIRGQVQAAEGVVTLVADQIEALDLSMVTAPSRDFR
jgi:error-prone DNA polymerase